MKTVFADTGYWIAVMSTTDASSERALAVSKALGKARVVTTEMVLAELLNALSKISTRALAIQCVDTIRASPNTEIIPQTSRQFAEAFDHYRQMRDKDWSVTDCASFAVMRVRGITEALAHDHHFEQAGFVALLR